MEKANTTTNVDDVLDKLFPWPTDVPLPIPRFGKTPAPLAQRLPPVGPQSRASNRFPFSLAWSDDELGLRVFVQEKEALNGLEIWAFVEAVIPGLRGKAVSVALVSEKGDRFKRMTILLDTPKGDADCSGEKCFGAAAELRAKLGDAVTVDAFLLE